MLNKPRFMSPSTNMPTMTTDVNGDSLNFSCIVDGNEGINAWQIVIYSLNDNSEVLNTGKQELSQPFYPIDEKNKNVTFSVDLKEYIGDTSTFINSADAFYWTITFWGTTGTTVTSCEEVFYANSKPEITLQYGFVELDENGKEQIKYTTCENVKEEFPLHYSKYYFKALYNQPEGVSLKRYGWRITDTSTGIVVLDTITQNQVYGIADNILCIYDGFLSDSKYSVEVYIETQNNDSITIDPVVFKVMYSTSFLTSDFRVDTLREEPAIILDWSSSVVMGGNMIDKDDNEISPDNVMYKQNYPISNPGDDTSVSVVIPNNHSILYNYGATSNLDISETCYITLSTHLLENGDLTIFDAQGEDKDGNEIVRRLSYIEGEFIYSVLDSNSTLFSKKYTPQHKPSDYVWYTITMSPVLTSDNGDYVSLKVNESIAEGGLYPQTGLLPSTSTIRYPSYGTWNLKVEGGE